MTSFYVQNMIFVWDPKFSLIVHWLDYQKFKLNLETKLNLKGKPMFQQSQLIFLTFFSLIIVATTTTTTTTHSIIFAASVHCIYSQQNHFQSNFGNAKIRIQLYRPGVAKVRPVGRMWPSNLFLRPLELFYYLEK